VADKHRRKNRFRGRKQKGEAEEKVSTMLFNFLPI
jgi:hypothetical protein